MSNQQVVVVTGSSSGFGRHTAERFADADWRVFATMRDARTRHNDVTQALELRGISVVELDVTNQRSADRAAEDILREVGGVDVLVNNAGAGYFGPTEAFTVERVQQQFEVNVFGPLRVNRAFLPSMRERRSGLIVYVSSVAGRIVLPGSGVYTASKFALEAFAEAASYELAGLGIDVAIVQPGAFETNIGNSRVGPDDTARLAGYAHLQRTAEAVQNWLRTASAKRDARDVAEAIYQLAVLPVGRRPLRTPVPPEPAVEAINAAAAAVQQQLLGALETTAPA